MNKIEKLKLAEKEYINSNIGLVSVSSKYHIQSYEFSKYLRKKGTIIRESKEHFLQKCEIAKKEYMNNGNISFSFLCKKHHIHFCGLSKYFKDNGIVIRRSKEDLVRRFELAKKEYINNKGITLNNICDEFHINHDTFSKYLKSINIIVRSNRKYFIDEYYFAFIDSEWKAYWLGFFCADGNINKNMYYLTIILQQKDREHLEKFAKIFNVPIRDEINCDKRNNKKNKQSIVNVNSIKMVNTLIEKGITPKKSLTMTDKVFDYIPDKFLNAFIRGYFDGDGCISHPKNSENFCISFCGTEKFLNRIKKIFEEKIGTNKKIKVYKSKNIYYLQYGGNRQIMAIKSWLYGENPTIFLERKKEKFDEIKRGKKYINKYSKYNGVTFCYKNIKKWRMAIIVNKKLYTKCFDTENKAGEAYNDAIDKYSLPQYLKNKIEN